MNRLLKRQLKKLYGSDLPNDKQFVELLEIINETYINYEEDFARLENILEISSKESFKELNNFKKGLFSAAIVSITDAKGNILKINENFCNISGYTENELLKQTHNLINSSVHTKRFWKDFWQTISSGKIWKGEICNLSKDKKSYWLETSVIPFVNENGVPFQYLSIGFDITKRKLFENEVKKLALVAQKTQNIVLITDKEKKIVWANDAFKKIKGFSLKEAIGMTPNWTLDENDENIIENLKVTDLLKPDSSFSGEAKDYKKNGEPIWVSISVNPIKENNKHIGYIAIETDITQQKNIELKLKKNENLLKAANKASGILLDSKADFHSSINLALETIGIALDVDRVYVFENHKDNEGNFLLSQKFEWSKANVTPQINNPDLQNIPYIEAGFGRWFELLSNKIPVKGFVDDFPEEEQPLLKSQDIISILVVPVFIDDAFWGFVGFDDCNKNHIWQTNEEEILINLANSIGSAYERNHAINKLKDSEQKFRLLIESATDIFYYTDEKGNFTYVNDIASKITGFSYEELLKMNYLDLIDPQYRKLVQVHYNKQSESGINVTYNQFPIITKQGNIKWVGQNVQLIKENGKIKAIQAIARDITDLVQTQKELKTSQEFLNNILNAFPNPVFVKNRKHQWVLANKAFCELINKKPHDIIGKTDFDFLDPEKAKYFVQLDETLFENKQNKEYQTIHHAEKENINLLVKKSYYQNKQEEFIIAVLTDITEIKNRERQLILLKKITEQISDAISVADYDGNLVYVNQQHANNLNKSVDELIGSNITQMEKRFKTIKDWQMHFNELKEKGSLLIEGENIRNDGSLMPVEANAKHIIIDDKEYIVATIRDISERIKAQKEILDKSQILNVILNNLPVILYRLNPEGVFTQIVGKGLERVGLQQNQLVGLNALDVYNEVDYPILNNHFKKALESKSSQYFLSEGEDQNGKWYYDNFTFSDETSKGFVIGFALDVTERKKAEELLQKSEMRFRLLVQNSTDITTILAADGKIIYESLSFYRILGYKENDIKDKNVFEFVHPDDIDRVQMEFAKGLQKGGISDPVEYRFKHKNGHWIFLESIGNNLLNEPGIEGIVINSRDITERKLAEQQTVNLKNFYERVLNNIPTDIAVFDINHKYIFVNNKAISDEHKRKWIVGHDDFEYCKEFDKPITIAQNRRILFNKVLETKEQISFEDKMQSSGKTVWVYRTLYPVLNNQNKIENVIGFGLDITQRKIAEQQLENYSKELEKKNKELDQFAYVVSHDLKAPLRGIDNLSVWIEEDLAGKVPDDVKRNLELMRSRVKRMENLINGILQYSRAGRMKYDKVDFNCNDVVNEIIDALSPSDKFTIKVQENMPNLISEKIAFEQVMTNYISNAIKYNNNPNPIIEITCNKNDNFYEFCVADNGPGISPQFHDKVFGIFQTLQSRDTVESTGVGLAIVKKMIEDKGGKVWIESQEGQGAKFYFSWPVNE